MPRNMEIGELKEDVEDFDKWFFRKEWLLTWGLTLLLPFIIIIGFPLLLLGFGETTVQVLYLITFSMWLVAVILISFHYLYRTPIKYVLAYHLKTLAQQVHKRDFSQAKDVDISVDTARKIVKHIDRYLDTYQSETTYYSDFDTFDEKRERLNELSLVLKKLASLFEDREKMTDERRHDIATDLNTLANNIYREDLGDHFESILGDLSEIVEDEPAAKFGAWNTIAENFANLRESIPLYLPVGVVWAYGGWAILNDSLPELLAVTDPFIAVLTWSTLILYLYQVLRSR